MVAYYLIQAAYTGGAWGTQIGNPQNVIDRVGPAIQGLGGSVESAFYAFGEYDIIAIVQFPDNVSAGAFSIAASAGGAVSAVKTTPLMTVDDGMEMMRKASGAGYRPPGG
ncbi:MAG: GYD domain-containing protein [Dehalococcoidia bacterium]